MVLKSAAVMGYPDSCFSLCDAAAVLCEMIEEGPELYIPKSKI
jgi:hypothetical protein